MMLRMFHGDVDAVCIVMGWVSRLAYMDFLSLFYFCSPRAHRESAERDERERMRSQL